MALYKPGDRVIVRSDLAVGGRYDMERGGSSNVVDDMLRFAGSVCTIESLNRVGRYFLVEDLEQWNWTDGMFVGLADVCEDFDVPDGCGCLI